MPTLTRLDGRSRIEGLLDSEEIRLRRELLAAIESVKDQVKLKNIQVLIEQGQFEEALALTGSIPVILSSAVDRAYIRSGESTAEQISNVIGVSVVFDITSDRAVNAMRNSKLRLISEFTRGQRGATREALVNGLQRGLNPKQQARAFRDSIGLTERQVKSVNNFRNLLERNSSESLSRRLRDRRFDSTVQRAIDSKVPLNAKQIDNMVNRYSSRFIKYRAKIIAESEALSVINQANEDMFSRSIEDDLFAEKKITKEWFTRRDDRVRSSHDFMLFQQRAEGESFLSGLGNLLRYPGDRNAPIEDIQGCRCFVTRLIE
jgi:hypothetical protein